MRDEFYVFVYEKDCKVRPAMEFNSMPGHLGFSVRADPGSSPFGATVLTRSLQPIKILVLELAYVRREHKVQGLFDLRGAHTTHVCSHQPCILPVYVWG